MSKRNFILLIIVLALGTISVFGFLYFRKITPTDTGSSIDTDNNFISKFNPFASKPNPKVVTPPIDVSGYQPNPVAEIPKAQLTKISSMPVAGFTVFTKERLKYV